MLDKLKKLMGKKQPKKESAKPKKTDKELATERGEPYVNVIQAFVNPKDPKNGYFEIDWNEHFIALLREHGYQGKTDEQIIDQWFKNLCRNMLEDDIENLNYNPNNTKRTVY
jgi:hypothetical protein